MQGLAYLSDMDSIDTESADYQNFTFMKYVNSQYFALPQFVYYVGSHVFGFMFINMITMGRDLDKSFISGNNTYKDIYMVTFISIIYFFMQGTIVLRNEQDLSGYCASNSTIPQI